jgi:hypothetical protein
VVGRRVKDTLSLVALIQGETLFFLIAIHVNVRGLLFEEKRFEEPKIKQYKGTMQQMVEIRAETSRTPTRARGFARRSGGQLQRKGFVRHAHNEQSIAFCVLSLTDSDGALCLIMSDYVTDIETKKKSIVSKPAGDSTDGGDTEEERRRGRLFDAVRGTTTRSYCQIAGNF